MHAYWKTQDPVKPLYADMLWSRPENRQQAGKLLVVGGSAAGFAAAAEGFNQAQRAGAGTVRVALPSALRRTVEKLFPAADFLPSTPAGSMARTALAELLDLAAWSDTVLLAGDFGRNSETAILLESFADKYDGPLIITGDALDYFLNLPKVLQRPESVAVATFTQAQKLFAGGRSATPLTSRLDLLHLAEALHGFTEGQAIRLVLERDRVVTIAVDGHVITTSFSIYDLPTQSHLAAAAAVWYMQNPGRPLDALATSVVAGRSD